MSPEAPIPPWFALYTDDVRSANHVVAALNYWRPQIRYQLTTNPARNEVAISFLTPGTHDERTLVSGDFLIFPRSAPELTILETPDMTYMLWG